MKKIVIGLVFMVVIIVGGFLILDPKNSQQSNETKDISNETPSDTPKKNYDNLKAKVFIKDANFQIQSFGGTPEKLPDGVTTISTPKNELFKITQPTRIKNTRLGYEVVIPAGFSFINDGLRQTRPEEYIDSIGYCKTFSKYGEGSNCITFQLDASGFDSSSGTLRDKIKNTSFDSAYQQAFSAAKDHSYIILGGYGFECNQPKKEFQNKVICTGETKELSQIIPGARVIKMTAKLTKDYIDSKKNAQNALSGVTIDSITHQADYIVFYEPLFSTQRNSVMKISVTGDSKNFLQEAEMVIGSLRFLSVDDQDVSNYTKIQVIRDIFGRATSYYLKKREIPKNYNTLNEFQKSRETHDTLSLVSKADLIKNFANQNQFFYAQHLSSSGKADGYRIGINLTDKNHPYFDYNSCNNRECLSKMGYGLQYFPTDNTKGCSGENESRCFYVECSPSLAKNYDTNHKLFCERLLFNAL